MNDQIKFYTLKEVAKMLKVTRRTLYNYITQDKLQAVKIGNVWRVSQENLEKFINGE